MSKEKLHLTEYHNETMEDIIKTGIYTIEFKNKPDIFYVGSAIRTNNKFGNSNKGFYARWREHLYHLYKNKHHNKKLQHNFNKYGKENLVFKILDFCEPLIAFGMEQYWMNILNSYNNGYNLACVVTKTQIGRKLTDDQKRKMSIRMMGEKNPNFERIYTIDEKQHLSDLCSKKVLQYDLDGNFINEYNSLKEAKEFVNGSDGNITKICKRNSVEITYKNCFWFYSTDDIDIKKYIKDALTKKDENIKNRMDKNRKPNECKKIAQYDLNNNFIREWDSIKEATESIHGSSGNISKVCSGKVKTYKGYIWKYQKINNK